LGARLKDAGAMSGLALAAGSKTAMDEDEAASAGGFGQFYKASPGRHPCFVPARISLLARRLPPSRAP
jgi:hypothetical protein